MGIRKLNKFLTNKNILNIYHNMQEFVNKIKLNDCTVNNNTDCQETMQQNNTSSGKIVIAIDFWLYVHKFLHSNRTDNILLGFWNQIMNMFSYGVIPLYIMDGYIPIEKQDRVNERNKK